MQAQGWFPDAAEEILTQDAPTAEVAPGMIMLVHIGMRGDVRGAVGTWLGAIGSGLAMEGIMTAPATLGPPQLCPGPEYQCVYAHGLTTPWMSGGEPSGSAGLGLPFHGLRFRLSAESAPFFDCAYDVAFIDGTRLDDVASPDIALAPSGAAVEAVRLRLKSRPAVPLLVLDDIDRGPQPPGGESPLNDTLIRLRLQSPAFQTRPPTINNAEVMPPETQGAMERSWGRRTFATRPVTLRVLDLAFVAQEGIVLDAMGNTMPGTTRLFSNRSIATAKAQVAQRRRDPGIPRISGVSLLCKSRAAPNFGHYLVDMFPKAWLARRLMPAQDLTFIVHDSAILPVVTESLARIGISPSAIVATDDGVVLCDRLMVFDGLTAHGDYQSPLCVRALTEMAERLPAALFRRLFIWRQTGGRPLLNQDAVAERLRGRGFVVVDPSRMTLAEQIVLFKGATTVVGALGAAMTNIAFCPVGTKVVALTSASYPDTFFWFLSQHRGHDYVEIRGQDLRAGPLEEEPWNAGFTIAEEDLAFLETL